MRRALFGLALLATAALPLAARADDKPADCVLRVIHALKEGDGIDPRITKLRPYLEKEQFRAWKKFILLDEKTATLQPKGAATFDLPNGRKAHLTYVEHLPDEKSHRMRLHLTINDAAKKVLSTTFVLDEDGVVLQAGQPHRGGVLILGISCASEK